jgi:hypothetical protein
MCEREKINNLKTYTQLIESLFSLTLMMTDDPKVHHQHRFLFTVYRNMKKKVAIGFALAIATLIFLQLTSSSFGESNEEQSNTLTYPVLQQRQALCQDYDGILFISRVIRKAGAGTMLFQSLVDSLLYAEKYNLLPYLWINDDENKPCYDIKVHGIGMNRTFTHLTGSISNLVGQGAMECHTNEGTRPGPPSFQNLQRHNYTLIGNGLWQSYFQPLSVTDPFNDPSCNTKPIFEMTRSQIMPDMHRCSEIAVRGWAFKGIPEALRPNDRSIADWLWDNRQRAAHMVKQYMHVQPWLEEKIHQANPNPKHCLAAHIRLTDKASGRDKKGLEAYRPYIEAYAEASYNSPIFIATDDGSVLQTIRNEWSERVSSRIISQQGAFRSEEENIPTFKLLEGDKHRSNTEALVEIYAMAQCSYFVHGYSGMAEAVVYISPKLHTRSVNIDDADKMTPNEFERMVRVKERSHILV